MPLARVNIEEFSAVATALHRLKRDRSWSNKHLYNRVRIQWESFGVETMKLFLTGRKVPTPGQVDTLADALQCNVAERIYLHRAAALDYGYRI